MNYFAHGVVFLDRPYLLAGTATPDWLMVADRRLRLRARQVEACLKKVRAEESMNRFEPCADPCTQLAQGILQHLADDQRFHANPAFLELSYRLSQQAAELLDGQQASALPVVSLPEEARGSAGMAADPPSDAPGGYAAFVGHLVLEVLLDAVLIEENPARLEQYYQALQTVDPELVQKTVNHMVPRSTQRLAPMIVEFRRLRVLWDYLEDRRLWYRLNQVMRRVGLPELPEAFVDLLPQARQAVACRKQQLLEGIPTGRDSGSKTYFAHNAPIRLTERIDNPQRPGMDGSRRP